MAKWKSPAKVLEVLQRGMTVGDLREALEDFPDDAYVVYACDYGDITHTQQALPFDSVEMYPSQVLTDTAYSSSGICLEGNPDDVFDGQHENRDDDVSVVILR